MQSIVSRQKEDKIKTIQYRNEKSDSGMDALGLSSFKDEKIDRLHGC